MHLKYIVNALCSCFLLFVFFSCSPEKVQETKFIRYQGNYNKDFNDLNDLHLEAALKIGIKPLADREEAEKIKNKLVEIKSKKTYEVEDLTHSIPYLVPRAADLLDKIGRDFADSLKNQNLGNYKLIVTSLTRTKNDVTRLGKKNGNASKNSAHMYGSTFDISWRRFIKEGKSSGNLTEEQLKMVLASVLWNLKKEGACYIKHEKKQACFHITAR
jgi:uncharacterized protein YcbK (DUF882 family)